MRTRAPIAAGLIACTLASGCLDAPAAEGEGREPTTEWGYVAPKGDETAFDAGSASDDGGGSCDHTSDEAPAPATAPAIPGPDQGPSSGGKPPSITSGAASSTAVGIDRDHCVAISAGSLDGYVVSDVAKLLGDARAQSPDYAYLVRQHDAARLRAPLVTAADGIAIAELQLEAASIEVLGADSDKDPVYQVDVPGGPEPFRYLVTSVDFEGEVELRRVELCRDHDQLAADFVFAGTGALPGVAHAVTLRVEYGGSILRSSPPVALEVR